MNISLIANSGIQLYSCDLTIDPNDDITRSVRFHEWFDQDDFKVRLEYAHFLPAEDVWVSKRTLSLEGYIDEDGKISEDINLNLLQQLTPDVDCFSINDIETPLEYFENQWIPIPFFEVDNAQKSHFGPTNWCRLKLIPQSKDGAKIKYKAVLAFDTKVPDEGNGEKSQETPSFYGNDESNNYAMCEDLSLLLNYCKESYKCGWVDDYIAKLVHGNTAAIPSEFPSYKYLAQYIYFVHYLAKMKAFPNVKLYTDKVDSFLNIDLVLDIGNSETCGLLFDSSDVNTPFSKVKKLNLQDFSSPDKSYNNPFSMRLAFYKANFGDIGFGSKQFVWPSILRVGKEAKSLIYLSKNENKDGKDKITNHSSPKRYLWDSDQAKVEWEYIQLEGSNPINTIYLEGVSEQFNSDGSFNASTDFGTESSYSKKSLMTFVFLEILAHANVQINSFAFREDHGDFNTPRRLKRIVITCPTAMSSKEQLVLRQSAEEASIILSRFYNNTYHIEFKIEDLKRKVEIIPSVTDLKRDLESLDDKKDWLYDEATCNQLVFIYAEISQRYLNKCHQFFDLYGKVRKDLLDYNKKSLTIGSIDIGAGTTDLMISAYQYDDTGVAALTPIPLFWESFNYAGDDLLKEVIQQVIIEGKIRDEKYRGCTGVISNTLLEKGIGNIEEKLNNFFGEDNNKINFRARQMRKDFNVQVSIPIAIRFLELTQLRKKDQILSFEDFFTRHKPSSALLDYFNDHFGFRFEDIRWKFIAERINEIIETVFEPLLKKLSSLLFAKGCDFVLIAGKPTSLHRIEELFLKFYPVSPDRIITLNKYRVGSWYPFSDGNGYFEDQKSLVAVGAMIALLGGKLDRLSNFRLNMNIMKRKLLSTAHYFGMYDKNTKNIETTFISPEINKSSVKVAGLPILIGVKRLDTIAYPGRPLYLLDFNNEKIAENIRQRKGIEDPEQLATEVENYKTNLKNTMPYTIKFVREYRKDREILLMETILNKNRDELSPKFFILKLKTLPDDKGYWLDTGEFILSIANR